MYINIYTYIFMKIMIYIEYVCMYVCMYVCRSQEFRLVSRNNTCHTRAITTAEGRFTLAHSDITT